MSNAAEQAWEKFTGGEVFDAHDRDFFYRGYRSAKAHALAASDTEQVQAAAARIEEIVFEATGQHVFRDGWTGAFTAAATELAQMFADVSAHPELAALSAITERRTVPIDWSAQENRHLGQRAEERQVFQGPWNEVQQ